MPKLAHPPPAAVHGLLTVKIGAAFAKRVRRFAHLENAVLELRRIEGAPVEWSMCVSDVAVTSDANNLCISLVSCSVRVRLYVSSHAKFGMWLKAVQKSASWLVQRYYELEAQPFARGHCAAVYRARDRARDAAVAVKHMDAAVTTAGAHVVGREVRVCKLVQHCNLVQVHDVFECSDGVYIVMECVEHTLQQLIERSSRVCEPLAAHIVRQMLCALSYLHGLNIVHRDIKPDNVLLTDASTKGTVKVCDFGLANFTGKRVWRRRASHGGGGGARGVAAAVAEARGDDGGGGGAAHKGFTAPTRLWHVAGGGGGGGGGVAGSGIDGQTLTTAVGAPSFTAPELLQRRAYGAPVDVWACGVTLFYMLSGRLPFAGASARDVTRAICDGERDALHGAVSHGAADLVERMLRRDPRQRITAESALQHGWLRSA